MYGGAGGAIIESGQENNINESSFPQDKGENEHSKGVTQEKENNETGSRKNDAREGVGHLHAQEHPMQPHQVNSRIITVIGRHRRNQSPEFMQLHFG